LELETLQNNVLLVAALAALGGLLIGMLLTYLTIGRGPSKSELNQKLASVEEEYEAHKEHVDKHFVTTSELVNDLTESYAKVYKHLSEGAEQLSGVVDMRHRLTRDDEGERSESADDSVIEVAGAGAAAAAGAESAESAAADADIDLEANVTGSEDIFDDPDGIASDEAVAETLTELEAAATDSSSKSGKS